MVDGERSFGVNWAAIRRAVGHQFDWAIHPGELLSDWMVDNNMTQVELAGAMGVSPPFVQGIRGKARPVTTKTALALEVATGVRAEVWLFFQITYDLHYARRKQLESLDSGLPDDDVGPPVA